MNDKNLDYITVIRDGNDIESKRGEVDEEKKMTKPETIVNIIKNKPEGKFIIFSSFDQTFEQIHLTLLENNIKFKLIKGTTQQIQKTIDDYKTGDLQVLFLNSKFNGSGINLQETTDIIIYHEMKIGRAHV